MLKSGSFVYPLVQSIVNGPEHILQPVDVCILAAHVILGIQRVSNVKSRNRHILKPSGFSVSVLDFVLILVVKTVVKRYVQ